MSDRRTGRERLKSSKASKPKFLKARMWTSYLVSLTNRDRGRIPDDIGNRILISNNMYITKNYLTSVLLVYELSLDTPVTLCQVIAEELRQEDCNAVVDYTFKNTDFDFDTDNTGLRSRIEMWKKTIQNKNSRKIEVERAVRCLYTVDEAKSGKKLRESRMYLQVRAKTGSELSRAERIIYKVFDRYGGICRPVTSDLEETLGYISMMSNYRDKKLKDIPAIINTEKTLAQMMPNTSCYTDLKGWYVGINQLNFTQVLLDTRRITMARNIYIVAPSGVGKTVIAKNICASAYEDGCAICIMDIKDYDYKEFVERNNGVTISLSQISKEYINSFRLRKSSCKEGEESIYCKDMINFSKKQLVILSGVTDPYETVLLEGFLDEFLDYMYTYLGVVKDNANTWYKTDDLTPFVVYEYMCSFINESYKSKYTTLLNKSMTIWNEYLTPEGTKSYIFTKELVYSHILESQIVDFNFNITQSDTVDLTIFKLKFEYMSRINGEYILHKYAQGIKCVKVLEECQVVDQALMKAYVREYTTRRAFNQDTILIGNSVAALTENSVAAALVENTTALFVGKLTKTARKTLKANFELNGKEKLLDEVCTNNELENCFLFINNMEKRALTTVVKVELDGEKSKNKEYMLYHNAER